MLNIHFGAGNIGRGFIGLLTSNAGYDVVFVDINSEVINKLNEDKCYNVKLLDGQDTVQKVENVSGVLLDDVETLNNSLLEADLITTALGVNNLKFIVKHFVNLVDMKMASSNNKLVDIICCENGIRISSVFKKMVYDELNEEQSLYADKYISFTDAAVDRIIPNQTNDNMLDVVVEPYFEWVVDQTMLKNTLDISDLKQVDNLDYYNQRKLLTVNAGHAAIAYVGYQNGFKYVYDAINDDKIYTLVNEYLMEVSRAIAYEFDFDIEEHKSYVSSTLSRFSNDLLVDDIIRVARNPLTKLAPNERLVKPLNILIDNNDSNFTSIIKVINAALAYDYAEDVEACELAEMVKTSSAREAFSSISLIDREDVLVQIGV